MRKETSAHLEQQHCSNKTIGGADYTSSADNFTNVTRFDFTSTTTYQQHIDGEDNDMCTSSDEENNAVMAALKMPMVGCETLRDMSAHQVPNMTTQHGLNTYLESSSEDHSAMQAKYKRALNDTDDMPSILSKTMATAAPLSISSYPTPSSHVNFSNI